MGDRSRRYALAMCMLMCALMAAVVAAPASAAPTWLTPLDMSSPGGDSGEPEVAVSSSGATLVVWVGHDGANFRVLARYRDPTGNIGPVDTLSAAGQNASQPDVAFDPSGNAIAVWTRNDGTDVRVQAAFRPLAGPWQAPATLSAAGTNSDDPQVSFDASGRALAVWSRFETPTSAVIETAIRPASGSFGAPTPLSVPGQIAYEPIVEAGPVLDENAAVCWTRSDGSGVNSLRVQCSRRRDVAGFPRTKSASPVLVPFVVAYNSCGATNREHAAPLNVASCAPPTRSSGVLTVGTPDANGFGANFTGSIKLTAVNGDVGTTADEADVQLDVAITDVRNNPSGTDYTGRVLVATTFTATDKRADAQENPALGTTVPIPLGIPIQCTASALTTIGSDCNASTTIDSLLPGAIVEGARASWELGQFSVKDAGPNGTGYGAGCPFTCGDGDEGTFLRQGVFVP